MFPTTTQKNWFVAAREAVSRGLSSTVDPVTLEIMVGTGIILAGAIGRPPSFSVMSMGATIAGRGLMEKMHGPIRHARAFATQRRGEEYSRR